MGEAKRGDWRRETVRNEGRRADMMRGLGDDVVTSRAKGGKDMVQDLG